MIRKILVANRGEIACRIIRTCRQLGLATVAIYSDADRSARHVRMADEAVALGGNTPAESYLKIDLVLAAALRTGANAIHPGYGFLAENATFAYAVKNAGMLFIGPPPEAIEAMGDKRVSKLVLKDVPFVPGYNDEDQTDDTLIAAAQSIGYPIMVKAAAGGGGKGMRQVNHPEDMPEALAAARREAQQAFGDTTLILERAIQRPRHIEIQLFGDQHGNLVTLGERECSIQRRHQKIVEETPSTALTPALRRAMCETALSIGEQLGYYSAGTIEFLLDEGGEYYFMEMNTRLQVEHPVTEEVYGVDLVRWQVEVARGTSLEQLIPPGIDLEDFAYSPYGHAIEVRLYAEDPANQFLPVTGTIADWQVPDFVRTETAIEPGSAISPYYDPMIAKIIAHGMSRSEAIHKLEYALSLVYLAGLKTNLGFLRRLLLHDDHLAGHIHTHLLDENPDLMQETPEASPWLLVAAAWAQQGEQTPWRNNPNRPVRHEFEIDGTHHIVELKQIDDHFQARIGADELYVEIVREEAHTLGVIVDGLRQRVHYTHLSPEQLWLQTISHACLARWINPLAAPSSRNEVAGNLRAPMPGQIIRLAVETGQTVQTGDVLLILEAMKMEHRIEAPYSGTIASIHYQIGEQVQADAVLLDITPAE